MNTDNKTIAFTSKTFVVKSFSYLGSSKKIKSLLLSSSKTKECFKDIDEINKRFFHKTGIEKNFSAHYFSQNRMKDNVFSKEEENDYYKSHIVIYALEMSLFHDHILSEITKKYNELYNRIDEFIENNKDAKKKMSLHDDFEILFNKKFGANGPILKSNIRKRKERDKYKRSNEKLSELISVFMKSSNNADRVIGVALNNLRSLSLLFDACKRAVNNTNTPLFDNVFLIIGDYNTAALCYEINETCEVDYDLFFSSEDVFGQLLNKKLLPIQNKICKTMDGPSDLIKFIDLNSFFDIKDNNTRFLKIKKRGETSRVVLIKNILEEKLLNNLRGLKWSSRFNVVKNMSFFFNLLCVWVCYYRSVSFEYLRNEVMNNKLFAEGYNNNYILERINWINDNNGQIKNKALISDSDIFFIDNATLVYGSMTPIHSLLSSGSIGNGLIDNLVKDHHLRYRVDDLFYSISSSVIYLSMLTRVCSALRAELDWVNKKHFIFRIAATRTYINLYNKSLIIYNSQAPFINQEKNSLHSILFDSMKMGKRTDNIEKSSSIAWENSNISNGFIFPLLQLLIAIIAYVITFNLCGKYTYNFWVKAGFSSGAVLFVFLLYFIIYRIANCGLKHNQLYRLCLSEIKSEEKEKKSFKNKKVDR